MQSDQDQAAAAAVAELARRGAVRRYPRHVILIQEGEQGDSIFVILSGRVKTFMSGSNGREFVLSFFGPGDYVGEMSLDGGPRSASVITLEPTVCSVVSRAVLDGYIRENPDFALALIRRVIRSARAATQSAGELALLDVYGRIVRLLQTQASAGDGSVPATLTRLTQQAIADRVGCSREMVSRIIKDLTTGGYLSVDKDGITLLRPLPAAW